MKIIELAQEFGAEWHRSLTDDNPVIFHRPEDLEAFAQAVIENYKASLVPVAYFLRESYDGTDEYNQTDPTVNRAIPLYTLPLGETK